MDDACHLLKDTKKGTLEGNQHLPLPPCHCSLHQAPAKRGFILTRYLIFHLIKILAQPHHQVPSNQSYVQYNYYSLHLKRSELPESTMLWKVYETPQLLGGFVGVKIWQALYFPCTLSVIAHSYCSAGVALAGSSCMLLTSLPVSIHTAHPDALKTWPLTGSLQGGQGEELEESPFPSHGYFSATKEKSQHWYLSPPFPLWWKLCYAKFNHAFWGCNNMQGSWT